MGSNPGYLFKSFLLYLPTYLYILPIIRFKVYSKSWNWVVAIFSGTGSNPIQRGWICSSLFGSESYRRWGDEPSLRSWLWLKKSSQVKVLFQSQTAPQTSFITSSSIGFLPKEQRIYPTSLHWIAFSGWKKNCETIWRTNQ